MKWSRAGHNEKMAKEFGNEEIEQLEKVGRATCAKDPRTTKNQLGFGSNFSYREYFSYTYCLKERTGEHRLAVDVDIYSLIGGIHH